MNEKRMDAEELILAPEKQEENVFSMASNNQRAAGDYVKNDSATAYNLPLNTQVTVRIDDPYDTVWFKFRATDNNAKFYSIRSTGSLDINAYLYHLDNLSNPIAMEIKKNGNTLLERPLTYGETYYVNVLTYGNDTGTFGFYVQTYSNTGYTPLVADTNSKEVSAKNTSSNANFADPVEMGSGAHTLKNDLMKIPGGQNLCLTANYNSLSLAEGSLGVGWYHNFEKKLVIDPWEAILYESPQEYQKYMNNECNSQYVCLTKGKSGNVLTVVSDGYMVDFNSQRHEYYDFSGRLVRMVDKHGFETNISYENNRTTITDGITNKKIHLIKDTTGKIISVQDDSGRTASLTYSANCLTEICDVNGNKLFFTYNSAKRVVTGTDSKGVRYFMNAYDNEGRVSKQWDGMGSPMSLFEYWGDGRRFTTNRNGDQSVRAFDNNGLLTSYTDENGNTITYTYDENFNLTCETDSLNKSTQKIFNCFNKPIQITDKNGNITYMTYDEKGNLLAITYPSEGEEVVQETFEYNTRNQVIRHTDLNDTVTVYEYDSTTGLLISKKVGNKAACLYGYTNGFLTSETDAKGNTTTYTYNNMGLVETKTDALNRTTRYEYDNAGNLLKVTDPNGKSITYEYDCNYQKVAQTDANGNRTTYAYNGNMKQTSVTLPDGNTIRYEYDPEDRMVKTIDQAGNQTVLEYDKAGRLTKKLFADDGCINYEYDAVGRLIYETDQILGEVGKNLDAMGNVLLIADSSGEFKEYQYDSMNRVVQMTNSREGITTYQYSKAGHLLRETNPLGHATVYTYDQYGNKLSVTDPKGNTTTFTYDANNNLLSTTDPLQNTTTFEYDCCNQLTKVTDANGHAVTYGYDALGRRTTVTDAKGNTVTTAYDANGNVLSITDAKGNVVSQKTYNALNLPATSVDTLGSKRYTYNALGKVAEILDINDQSKKIYGYNVVGHNISVTDEKNGISTASRDLLGNVTALTGPLGGETEYTYDAMSRVIAQTTTSGGVVSNTYGLLNVKDKITNARGQDRLFYHNNIGQLTSFVDPDGSAEYIYDANGNLLKVSDDNCCLSRTYDALNRVISYTDTEQNTLRYQYDAVGNLTQLTYPDNSKVTYGYDVNNNLISVIDWAGRTTLYTYDANNQVISITKPDGSVTTNTYDVMQRLVSSVDRAANGNFISGFEYTYDHLSRIVEEKDLAKNLQMRYTYDELSRVCNRETTDLCTGAVTNENFSYDAAGNITSAAGNSCFGYDANNRLTMYMDQSVTYDADGNMTAAFLNNQTTAFTYDSKNRLISDGTYTYFYNAEDVRVRSVGNCVENVYTYDTVSKLSRLLVKTTNGVTTKYVYGLGLIGEAIGSAFKTYHYDYRGSTVAITNASGAVTDTFAYDTYGKLMARTGSTNTPFLYNGRDGVMTEPNGLYYMRARYYSPELRRFINADILAGEISNAITLNRYAYANGNPVSNVDPFGLSAEKGCYVSPIVDFDLFRFTDEYYWANETINFGLNEDQVKNIYNYLMRELINAERPNNIAIGTWTKGIQEDIDWVEKTFGQGSKLAKALKAAPYVSVGIETIDGVIGNILDKEEWQITVAEAATDITFGLLGVAIGTAAGSIIPGAGTAAGAVAGAIVGFGVDLMFYTVTEVITVNGKSLKDVTTEAVADLLTW